MPKLKTKSAAKKRMRVNAAGKVKIKQAHTRHRLISKPKKMKRQAKGCEILNESDTTAVLTYYLPYARKRKTRADRRARLTVQTPETLRSTEEAA